MTARFVQLQAIPYVPGRVKAPLCRGNRPHTQGKIVILESTQIRQLKGHPAGMLIADGAPFSHSTIAARSLGVPTAILKTGQAERLPSGQEVILDGATGIVTSETEPTELVQWPIPAPPIAGQPVLTSDGEPVWLYVSVRSPDEAATAVSTGAGGIGLVRSEFLFPKDGNQPDTTFYAQVFGQICKSAGTLPVVIRLLDISPDKQPDWLPSLPGINTPLGMQGVRLFNLEPVARVVTAQLEALERIAESHRIGLLIPYLSRFEELLEWRDRIRRRLPQLPLGAMVETPSAALDIASWLEMVDFLSVGCNDLMQNLFGADRDLPALRAYLDPYAPVLYRLFQQMAESAGNRLQRVRLCGLLPQLPGVLPVMLGLGFRTFSVDGIMVPYLAQLIETTDASAAKRLSEQVCAARWSREVKALLACRGHLAEQTIE